MTLVLVSLPLFQRLLQVAGELLEIFYEDGDEVPVLVNVCAIGRPGDSIEGLNVSVFIEDLKQLPGRCGFTLECRFIRLIGKEDIAAALWRQM